MIEPRAPRLRRPIFLLGSERSGTNLMRAIMGSHPSIDAPAPVHLLLTFASQLPDYGELAEPENFRRLCEHMATSLHNPIFKWTSPLEVDALEAAAPGRTFMELFDHVYATEAEANGSARVFFKENDTYSHAWMLHHHYPDAKFIYLARDGRDVVSSWLESPTTLTSLTQTAHDWSREQQQGLLFHSMLQGSGRVLGVRYEELTAQPERTVRALCDFIGEDFVPEMLEFHKRKTVKESAESITAWRNIARPVMRDNSGNYRHKLSGPQIFAFERVAFKELTLLGYELDYPVGQLRLSRRVTRRAIQGALFLQRLARGARISRKELHVRAARMGIAEQRELELDDSRGPVVRPQACVW